MATRLDVRRIRTARNQCLFRELNDRLLRLEQARGRAPLLELVCECTHGNCAALLELTAREYETIRGDGACFAVAPGHEVPTLERVVHVSDSVVTVQKIGAGHAVAMRRDPRRARAAVRERTPQRTIALV